jgi:hypothetical protein
MDLRKSCRLPTWTKTIKTATSCTPWVHMRLNQKARDIAWFGSNVAKTMHTGAVRSGTEVCGVSHLENIESFWHDVALTQIRNRWKKLKFRNDKSGFYVTWCHQYRCGAVLQTPSQGAHTSPSGPRYAFIYRNIQMSACVVCNKQRCGSAQFSCGSGSDFSR